MAKKKEIYFGKGFKRIYFVIAGLYMAIWFAYAFYGNIKTAWIVKIFIFNLAWPVALYFFLNGLLQVSKNK